MKKYIFSVLLLCTTLIGNNENQNNKILNLVGFDLLQAVGSPSFNTSLYPAFKNMRIDILAAKRLVRKQLGINQISEFINTYKNYSIKEYSQQEIEKLNYAIKVLELAGDNSILCLDETETDRDKLIIARGEIEQELRLKGLMELPNIDTMSEDDIKNALDDNNSFIVLSVFAKSYKDKIDGFCNDRLNVNLCTKKDFKEAIKMIQSVGTIEDFLKKYYNYSFKEEYCKQDAKKELSKEDRALYYASAIMESLHDDNARYSLMYNLYLYDKCTSSKPSASDNGIVSNINKEVGKLEQDVKEEVSALRNDYRAYWWLPSLLKKTRDKIFPKNFVTERSNIIDFNGVD